MRSKHKTFLFQSISHLCVKEFGQHVTFHTFDDFRYYTQKCSTVQRRKTTNRIRRLLQPWTYACGRMLGPLPQVCSLPLCLRIVAHLHSRINAFAAYTGTGYQRLQIFCGPHTNNLRRHLRSSEAQTCFLLDPTEAHRRHRDLDVLVPASYYNQIIHNAAHHSFRARHRGRRRHKG